MGSGFGILAARIVIGGCGCGCGCGWNVRRRVRSTERREIVERLAELTGAVSDLCMQLAA
ncbi:hypothetical protein [Micromonospora sp. CA-111912]|uniref:hypothetical protein n=1 Tax=Micromonospora sp. CA-111912 TaxID=3239955 RepID=UPI003D94E850